MITKKTFIALCSLLLSISVASAMSYHDNEVEFKNADAEEAIKGSFVISNYKITKGQDPDHKNAIGNIVKFNKDNKLIFKSGRHGSEDVATWFSELISANQNTFGHDPDKLNFAFLGDLNIIINKNKYIFNDIMLAQGHSGSTNNWWFGGKSCKKNDKETEVICKGINVSKNKIESLLFERGDSDFPFTVKVRPNSK